MRAENQKFFKAAYREFQEYGQQSPESGIGMQRR